MSSIKTSVKDRSVSPVPSIKKQSSFEALTAKFTKKSSYTNMPTSPKSSAKRPDEAPTPPKPPTSLNRQGLKDFLLAQENNPSLDGVVRMGNMCFEEIDGHGLYPRLPEICYPTALLLEFANHRNPVLLTPLEQRKLGFSHYHAWCNGGIVAEVSYYTFHCTVICCDML